MWATIVFSSALVVKQKLPNCLEETLSGAITLVICGMNKENDKEGHLHSVRNAACATLVGKLPMSPAAKYVSAHIFYNSADLTPLLLQCVAPLLVDLRQNRAISRAFFIRYWLGGPHIRLRLLPASGVASADISKAIEPIIRQFFTRSPSPTDVDRKTYGPMMRQWFEAEYGRDAYLAQYGDSREIPIYPNNSLHYIDYEPEYAVYGGPEGVSLAEAHFDCSSSTVLDVLQIAQGWSRAAMLSKAMEVMLHFVTAFYSTPDESARFLRHYVARWSTGTFFPARDHWEPGFERAYGQQSAALREHVDRVLSTEGSAESQQTYLFNNWQRHARELQREISALYLSNRLHFSHPASQAAATNNLLAAYLHMTNNRLGLRISEEAYVAYLLARTLEDLG